MSEIQGTLFSSKRKELCTFVQITAPPSTSRTKNYVALGETACPTIGNKALALVAQAIRLRFFDFFTDP